MSVYLYVSVWLLSVVQIPACGLWIFITEPLQQRLHGTGGMFYLLMHKTQSPTHTHTHTSISPDISGMKASIFLCGGSTPVSVALCVEMMRNKSPQRVAICSNHRKSPRQITGSHRGKSQEVTAPLVKTTHL